MPDDAKDIIRRIFDAAVQDEDAAAVARRFLEVSRTRRVSKAGFRAALEAMVSEHTASQDASS